MATVGTLIFEMSANVARLQADMAKAKSTVETAMSGIQGAANVAKQALGALGLAASAVGFVDMIRSTISAEAELLRLSQRTGTTVEALSSLKGVAKLSGTDMDSVAQSMQKLSKAMVEAESGKGKPAQVFEQLGISVRNASGEMRPANEVMQELAKKLAGMKDQTLAVAMAQEVMGKSGANLLPFLYELANAGKLVAKVTTDQAEAAKQFEDNLIKLQASSNKLKMALANELLPTLNDITNAMVQAKKEGGLLDAVLAGIRTALTGTDRDKAQREMLDLVERQLALEKQLADVSDPSKAYRGVSAARLKKELDDVNARLQTVLAYKHQLDAEDEAAKPKKTEQKGGPKGGIPDAEAVKSQYASILSGLQNQTIATQQLSIYETTLFNIQTQRYGFLTQAQKNELLAQAQSLDLIKKWQETARQNAAELERQKAASEQQNAQLEAEAEAYRKLIDPTRVYYQQIAEIAKLMNSGKLSGEEGDRAYEIINAKIAALVNVKESAAKTDDIARQLGLTFTSAFEDAAVKGKALRDVINGIGQDIARMVLRKGVTEPLGNMVTGFVKDSGASSFLADLFGGVRASGGPVAGGQAYLVGENGPELMVPGSSGTVIPNSALGGGSGGSVNVNLTVNALDSRSMLQAIAPLKGLFVSWTQQAFNQRGVSTPMG